MRDENDSREVRLAKGQFVWSSTRTNAMRWEDRGRFRCVSEEAAKRRARKTTARRQRLGRY